MFDLVLFQPEIPPNTGNIIRLVANTGCRLHLVKPLGFDLEDKQLKRAGLDYHEYADVRAHDDWPTCREYFKDRRVFAFTTRGSSPYSEVAYQLGDVFLFGPETRGLPEAVLAEFSSGRRLRLPMQSGQRSLNLSNACAVVVFEAWRQNGFAGGS